MQSNIFICSRSAVTFRRLLAEASHDLESLEKLWAEGKREAIAEELKKIEEIKEKEEEREELTEILDSFFDPEKKPVKPVVNRRKNSERNGNSNGNRRRRGPRGRSADKENNQGPRSNSDRRPNSNRNRRRSAGDKRSHNNETAQTGNGKDSTLSAIRKETQQVDGNQTPVLVASN